MGRVTSGAFSSSVFFFLLPLRRHRVPKSVSRLELLEYENLVVSASNPPPVTNSSWTTGSSVGWLRKKRRRSGPVLGVGYEQIRMPSTKLLSSKIRRERIEDGRRLCEQHKRRRKKKKQLRQMQRRKLRLMTVAVRRLLFWNLSPSLGQKSPVYVYDSRTER